MKNTWNFKERVRKAVKRNRLLYLMAVILLGKKPLVDGLKKEMFGLNNSFRAGPTSIFVNCRIDVRGNDNQVTISDFCSFHNVTFIICGDNNRIRIGEGVKFKFGGALHIEDQGCLIHIGSSTTFEEAHIAVTEPGSQVIVGRDCMFAYDVDIRTGDSHSIIDMTTNRRINFARNVWIDDHVWVGPHCSILKGVAIKKNCVVATRSVLTRSFPQEGVIIGGSPSRILKENITWDRRRIFPDDQKVA